MNPRPTERERTPKEEAELARLIDEQRRDDVPWIFKQSFVDFSLDHTNADGSRYADVVGLDEDGHPRSFLRPERSNGVQGARQPKITGDMLEALYASLVYFRRVTQMRLTAGVGKRRRFERDILAGWVWEHDRRGFPRLAMEIVTGRSSTNIAELLAYHRSKRVNEPPEPQPWAARRRAHRKRTATEFKFSDGHTIVVIEPSSRRNFWPNRPAPGRYWAAERSRVFQPPATADATRGRPDDPTPASPARSERATIKTTSLEEAQL
jgi:hypothetical protein